jgi:hypothetical protein
MYSTIDQKIECMLDVACAAMHWDARDNGLLGIRGALLALLGKFSRELGIGFFRA